jgi:alpha-1,4-digalacturonate transport system permease protein
LRSACSKRRCGCCQRLLGVPRIGWAFVAPNLVVLGLFTFLPIAIDFHYALTGGAQLFPDRAAVRGRRELRHPVRVHRITSIRRPAARTCSGARSTTPGTFAMLQVALMVLFSSITALVLNRKILGRGFFRGVFFYPVLLSPSWWR